jgi:hypothetical protein
VNANAQAIDALAQFNWRYRNDPLGYVRNAYLWGKGELVGHSGPDTWQERALGYITTRLAESDDPVMFAAASGHGVGKGAFVAMLSDWGLSTMIDTKIVVTANTDKQLRTKTWPELSKWGRLSPNREAFKIEGESIRSVEHAHNHTWRLDAVPWSANNTEAFAGLHNKGRRILVIFDEASAIDDAIWEVTEGALTDKDTQIIWIALGNPTQATGRFRECFGRRRNRWHSVHIDSRTSRFTNKALIEQWEAEYGESSDFFKVRVKGEFPSQSVDQLIGTDVVEAARQREAEAMLTDPVIIGVDTGRGVAESVICIRHGNDARRIKWLTFRERDSMITASRVCAMIDDLTKHGGQVGGVFIDNGDTGGPVADRVRQLGYDCVKIDFGAKATRQDRYADKAAEMWCLMRDWLEEGGGIPDDPILATQLTSRERYHDKQQRVKLEPKEHLADRGLESPDRADALALTFAHPVATVEPEPVRLPWGMQEAPKKGFSLHDPNPFEGM